MRYLLLPVCLLACGDNSGTVRPDAAEQPDVDAAIDAPTVIPCTYTEMNDGGNDDFFGNGAPEDTGVSFGTQPFGICGKFNMGHYNNGRMNLDVDSYKFTVPANTTAILHLTSPGAEAFDTVLIEIYGMSNAIDETGEFTGNFATTSATLPPGDYEITLQAYDATDATSNLDYKLTVKLDPPTRCAKSTMSPPAFTEANEGTLGGNNDVYEVYYGQNSSRGFTTLTTDAPEPTGITVAPGTNYRVSGVNSTFTATPVSWQDSFQDRDTYAITMGATTNQLSLRLNWPGTTADFDFLVFPMGALVEKATGYYPGNMEDEFTTLAVTPGATYWVFVGADNASTGQPINYDLTICGDTFTP